MSVVPLTLTISLCLVFTFVLFFLREFTRRRFSGAESESLLPLADETPRLARAVAEAPGNCGHHHEEKKPGHVCLGNCAACRARKAQRADIPRELIA